MKGDTELHRDVLDELDWEPSINAAGIRVGVSRGIVTLTGSVASYNEKVTAEHATKRVDGVKAVANDIEVQLLGIHERTDTDIARAVVDALRWKTLVPDEAIKASVSKGWVTLDGEVDWYYQREAVELAIRALRGVRGVIDQISVKPRASATEVKSLIEAAFRRSAELKAEKIRVETHNGKVTLHGDLSSWTERQEAERTAWAAPGVSVVENLIAITPSDS